MYEEREEDLLLSRSDRQLRWLADSFEQNQRVRIATGERIRAVLQGRDKTWTSEDDWVLPENWLTLEDIAALLADAETKREEKLIKKRAKNQVKEILKEIRRGQHTGPVFLLGRTYHRHSAEEKVLKKDMIRPLHEHICWPWLDQVNGMGPILSCKILARLNPYMARHASSFCSYCGLATVEANQYRCSVCGLDRAWPPNFKVTGTHIPLGKKKGNCKGKLEKIAGPEDGVRCAQPRAAKGERATYDAYAKKIMYLIGGAFMKAKGPYERFYRARRAKLETERSGWTDGRLHYGAIRATEKLFLSNLWEEWRTQLGLPVGEPYPQAILGHNSKLGPWDMVGK